MIAVNENIKELYKSDSVPKQYQISIYRSNLGALFPADDLYPSDTLFPLAGGEADVVIENDRIVNESVSFRQSICDSGDIIFGKCNAAELVFKCADVNNLFVGDELLVRQYIGDEYVSMGAYYIASIQKSADRRFRTVTAYDRMTRFDINVADWYNGLWAGGVTSITIADMRASLCAYCGVPTRDATLVNDAITVTKTMVPTEVSGREILESICEINGVFGIIDNAGYLKFITLDTTSAVETIPVGARRSLDHEDYSVDPIDALVIRQESNDIGASVGSGNNPYIIQGNFLAYGKSSAQLTTIATNIFGVISGVAYVPVQLQCRGLPYLEPGDCIDITMQDGSETRTLVLSRTLSGVQSLVDDIRASGNEKRAETYGVSKSLIQLQGKANLFERTVEQTVSRVEDLEQGYTEITQTFDSLTFDVDNGESSSVLTLKAGETTLASAEIEITGMVTFSDLSGTGTSVINGSNITTGTITSANYSESGGAVTAGLKINLTNGTISSKNFSVDSSGNVTITGIINATAGSIGGSAISMPWYIGTDTTTGVSFLWNGKHAFMADNYEGVYIGTDGVACGSNSGNGVVKITRAGVFSAPVVLVDHGYIRLTHPDYPAVSSISFTSSGNLDIFNTANGGISITALNNGIGIIAYSGNVLLSASDQVNISGDTINLIAPNGVYINGVRVD